MFLSPEELEELDGTAESVYVANTRRAHEVFFSTKGETKLVNEARRICNQCPVAEDCFAFSLKMKLRDGVWGGSSARCRRRIQKMKSYAQATFEFDNIDFASLETEDIEDMLSDTWESLDDLEVDEDPWDEVWASDDYLKGLGLDDI